MTTIFRTEVDGADAKVIYSDPHRQTALVELDAEELCQLLSAKATELRKQTDVVEREKKRQKTLETQHGEIVEELRKRGDATASGQTGLFEQRIVADARAAARETNGAASSADEPMPAGGVARVALPAVRGDGTREIIDAETGAVHANDGGAYIRIPQPNAPEFCVCGSLMASTVAEHDREHEAYVATLGPELAPAAIPPATAATAKAAKTATAAPSRRKNR